MQRHIFFTALGGAQEVGRSSFLVDSGEKIVLDRGVKLSSRKTEYPLPVNVYLDAVVISHAHMDHAGHLPHLFLKTNTPTFLTPPTLDTAKILWFDTLKIAGLEAMQPEFTEEEIAKTEQYSFPLEYKRKVEISKNVSLEFFDAGHILGSAMAKLSFPEKEVLYTGDFKVDDTKLHYGADLKVGKVHTVIIESTYGDREQLPRKETEKLFVEKVREVVADGGHCIVPAFAVGRSQEVIDVLVGHKVNVPIYLDGMGQKAARVMLDYPKYLKDHHSLKKSMAFAKWVKNKNVRKKALNQPGVIVSTAGMLQGGPVLNYISRIYKDTKSAVLLTGFQVEDSPGRMLLETGKMHVDGRTVDVKMQVFKFDFSAHASQSELLKSLKKWSPAKAVLVHGDTSVLPVFKKEIESSLGIEAVIPSIGKEIVL